MWSFHISPILENEVSDTIVLTPGTAALATHLNNDILYSYTEDYITLVCGC